MKRLSLATLCGALIAQAQATDTLEPTLDVRGYPQSSVVVTFLPIPIPAAVVYAALGAAGTSLR